MTDDKWGEEKRKCKFCGGPIPKRVQGERKKDYCSQYCRTYASSRANRGARK